MPITQQSQNSTNTITVRQMIDRNFTDFTAVIDWINNVTSDFNTDDPELGVSARALFLLNQKVDAMVSGGGGIPELVDGEDLIPGDERTTVIDGKVTIIQAKDINGDGSGYRAAPVFDIDQWEVLSTQEEPEPPLIPVWITAPTEPAELLNLSYIDPAGGLPAAAKNRAMYVAEEVTIDGVVFQANSVYRTTENTAANNPAAWALYIDNDVAPDKIINLPPEYRPNIDEFEIGETKLLYNLTTEPQRMYAPNTGTGEIVPPTWTSEIADTGTSPVIWVETATNNVGSLVMVYKNADGNSYMNYRINGAWQLNAVDLGVSTHTDSVSVARAAISDGNIITVITRSNYVSSFRRYNADTHAWLDDWVDLPNRMRAGAYHIVHRESDIPVLLYRHFDNPDIWAVYYAEYNGALNQFVGDTRLGDNGSGSPEGDGGGTIDVAVNKLGDIVVAWRGRNAGTGLYSYHVARYIHGESWDVTETTLSDDAPGYHPPRVAISDTGAAMVLLQARLQDNPTQGQIYAWHSAAGSRIWTVAPDLIATDFLGTGFSELAQVVAFKNGNFLAVWRDQDRKLHSRRFIPASGWEFAQADIYPAERVRGKLAVTIDDNEQVYVFFEEQAAADPQSIIYESKYDSDNNTWSDALQIGVTGVTSTAEATKFLKAESVGLGENVVFWEQEVAGVAELAQNEFAAPGGAGGVQNSAFKAADYITTHPSNQIEAGLNFINAQPGELWRLWRPSVATVLVAHLETSTAAATPVGNEIQEHTPGEAVEVSAQRIFDNGNGVRIYIAKDENGDGSAWVTPGIFDATQWYDAGAVTQNDKDYFAINSAARANIEINSHNYVTFIGAGADPFVLPTPSTSDGNAWLRISVPDTMFVQEDAVVQGASGGNITIRKGTSALAYHDGTAWYWVINGSAAQFQALEDQILQAENAAFNTQQDLDDYRDNTVNPHIADNQIHIQQAERQKWDATFAALGSALNTTHMGTFNGVTIRDFPSVKDALQDLENAIEGDPVQVIAADIAARDAALGSSAEGSLIHVTDASADAAVTTGWAKYQLVQGAWQFYQSEEKLTALVQSLNSAWNNPTDPNYTTQALASWQQMYEAIGVGRGWYDAGVAATFDANDMPNNSRERLVHFHTSATVANMPLGHTTNMAGMLSAEFSDDNGIGSQIAFISEHGSQLGLGIWSRTWQGGSWGSWVRFTDDHWIETDLIVGTLTAPLGSKIILALGKVISLTTLGSGDIKAIRVVPRTTWDECEPIVTSDAGWTVVGQPTTKTSQEILFVPNQGTQVWEAKSVSNNIFEEVVFPGNNGAIQVSKKNFYYSDETVPDFSVVQGVKGNEFVIAIASYPAGSSAFDQQNGTVTETLYTRDDDSWVATEGGSSGSVLVDNRELIASTINAAPITLPNGDTWSTLLAKYDRLRFVAEATFGQRYTFDIEVESSEWVEETESRSLSFFSDGSSTVRWQLGSPTDNTATWVGAGGWGTASLKIYGIKTSDEYVNRNAVLEVEDVEVNLIDVEGANNTLYPFSTGETWADIKANYEQLRFDITVSDAGQALVVPHTIYFSPDDLELFQVNAGTRLINESGVIVNINTLTDTDTGFTYVQSSGDAGANDRMRFRVTGIKARKTVVTDIQNEDRTLSTTELDTGRVDHLGNAIYRRVIDGVAVTTDGNNNVIFTGAVGLQTVIDSHFVLRNSANPLGQIPVPYNDGAVMAVWEISNAGSLFARSTWVGGIAPTLHGWIEYTK